MQKTATFDLAPGLVLLLQQAEDFTQRLCKSQADILSQDNHKKAVQYR